MKAEDEGRQLSASFREEHDLGLGPLSDLVTIIEQTQGIDVAVLDAGPDEHGMTMRDTVRNVVMVAVARTKNPMRQRSTLAHELAHVLFSDYAGSKVGAWDERSYEEVRADAFARHLLVPEQGLRRILGSKKTLGLPDLSLLVQRFQASPQVLAIQLAQTDYIDHARKHEWMNQWTPDLAARFGWLDQYRALQLESGARRAPQRLLARAIEGYLANVVSLETIGRLRGVASAEIATDFAKAGIVPNEQSVAWAKLGSPRHDNDFSDLDELDAIEQ